MMIDDLPFRQVGEPKTGEIVCVVDHATNFVPEDIELGIPADLLEQHIALDIGVEGIAGRMARRHGIPAHLATVSRLVCDMHREEDHKNVVPIESDGHLIPGNIGADVEARLNRFHRPYHKALETLITDTKRKFGYCVVVDCHSMPSIGGPLDPDAGRGRAEFIIGDCFGSACAPYITDAIERVIRGCGYAVARNKPFAGGFTTRHYGQPRDGVHTVQIEINRALYMDEINIRKNDNFDRVAAQMTDVVAALARLTAQDLAAE